MNEGGERRDSCGAGELHRRRRVRFPHSFSAENQPSSVGSAQSRQDFECLDNPVISKDTMSGDSSAAWYLQAAQDCLTEASRTPRRYASGPRTRPTPDILNSDILLPSEAVKLSQQVRTIREASVVSGWLEHYLSSTVAERHTVLRGCVSGRYYPLGWLMSRIGLDYVHNGPLIQTDSDSEEM